MVLSTTSKYALKALTTLAAAEGDNFVAVDELAAASGVPAPYLSKLIKALSHAGLVETKKGAGGGVRLGAKSISFYDICSVLHDPIIEQTCLLSRFPCDSRTPCPFHASWRIERERLGKYLKKQKISRQ